MLCCFFRYTHCRWSSINIRCPPHSLDPKCLLCIVLGGQWTFLVYTKKRSTKVVLCPVRVYYCCITPSLSFQLAFNCVALFDFTFAYLTLDCHSEISCVEGVIRVGAPFALPATASSPSSPSHLLQGTDGEHAPLSSGTDDRSLDHVPREERTTQWKAALLTCPPRHIDLTTSALLQRAAIERKELLILEDCLRAHSVPSALAAR